MSTTWMDAQSVLSFYQACLTVLAWLLAGFTCVAVLSTLLFFYQDRFSSPVQSIGGALELAFRDNVRGTKL
jgi:hypothetical protein